MFNSWPVINTGKSKLFIPASKERVAYLAMVPLAPNLLTTGELDYGEIGVLRRLAVFVDRVRHNRNHFTAGIIRHRQAERKQASDHEQRKCDIR